MSKVSIIIPVYNSEKYLRKCLDSIVTQTYTNFEAVLVDDGSTDNSGKICDEYAAKDKRFRVFHKPNGGVSSARNLALENMQGDWFTFVDSDDYLYENSLATYVSHVSDDVDCVECSYRKVDIQDNDITNRNEGEISRKITFEEALMDLFDSIVPNKYNGYMCTRLFRTSVMKEHNLRFHEDIYIKEDGLFIVEFLCSSKRDVYISSEIIYAYVQNDSSVMNSLKMKYNPKYISDIDACARIYKAIEKVSENKELLRISKYAIYYIHRAVRGHIWHKNPLNFKAWWQLFAKTIKGTSLTYLIKAYIDSLTSKFRKKKQS